MHINLTKVSVFCASSTKLKPEYINAAKELGHILAQNNISISFGGQKNGLMGALADSVLNDNGEIIGVALKEMKDINWVHPGLIRNNIIYTENTNDRIMTMIDRTEAVIVLPGGSGTYEELFTVLTLKRLAIYNKPIIVVNVLDYFVLFDMMFRKSVAENFMKKEHINMYSMINDVKYIVDCIRDAPKWDNKDIKDALVD